MHIFSCSTYNQTFVAVWKTWINQIVIAAKISHKLA